MKSLQKLALSLLFFALAGCIQDRYQLPDGTKLERSELFESKFLTAESPGKKIQFTYKKNGELCEFVEWEWPYRKKISSGEEIPSSAHEDSEKYKRMIGE